MPVLNRNAQDIDILYFFEHEERELETAAVVTAILRNRFNRSVVVQKCSNTDVFLSLFRYHPKLLVLPYCYSSESWPVRVFYKIYGSQLTYVNLNFEQILAPFFKEPKRPRGTFVREEVVHCVWNDKFRTWLEEHGVETQYIVTTGSPQQALYLQDHQALHRPRTTLARKEDLDPHQKWVLFPVNYAGAFFSEWDIQSRIERGFPKNLMDPYLKFCRRSLDVVLDWILNAAEYYDDHVFIIRPRPSEDEVAYHCLFRQKRIDIPPNVRVVKSGPVRDWILNSDIVFSSFSTTLLDSALANKPTYSLTPFPIPGWLTSEWTHLVPQVESADEFYSAIETLEGTQPPQELIRYVRRIFGVEDNNPLQQIAYLLDRLLVSESRNSSRENGGLPKVDAQLFLALKYRYFRSVVRKWLSRYGLEVLGARRGIDDFQAEAAVERITAKIDP